MKNWQIKASLFLNYFVFAILLNSVGTVILQVQNSYGVSPGSASVLEAFKDLSIAIVSFLLASYITRFGYKNSMLAALALVTVVCFIVPFAPEFWATKMLFAAVGASFALIKMSVYSTIGLVTKDEKEHISLMNFIESFFMVGITAGYFIFSAFVDDANPKSTAWLNVYYLLGALSLVAFLLLVTAPLDESDAKSPEDGSSLAPDFGQMFRLLGGAIGAGVRALRIFLCAHRAEYYELAAHIQSGSVAASNFAQYPDGGHFVHFHGFGTASCGHCIPADQLVYCAYVLSVDRGSFGSPGYSSGLRRECRYGHRLG